MKRTELIIIAVILLSFIIGVYFYNIMPEKIASHWDAKGQVNGYMSKFWGLFLLPFISVALFLFFELIPIIDPHKKNIAKFRKDYNKFILIIILFLFYLYLLTILWNVNVKFNLIQLLVPAFAAIFYSTGVLIKSAKRNWFIGIRTPWTLSNERVWNKTHKIGAKLFKISGIISLVGIIIPSYGIFFILIPVLASSIYLVIYSYIEFKRLKH